MNSISIVCHSPGFLAAFTFGAAAPQAAGQHQHPASPPMIKEGKEAAAKMKADDPKVKSATAKLDDELGRPPTQEEVAKELGLPKKKLSIVKSATEWDMAQQSYLAGDFDKARATIHNTPPARRSEFAREVWARRRRSGSAGCARASSSSSRSPRTR